jgi:hypothetical protein
VNTRRWAIATAAFGVATLILFVGFALLPQVTAAGECLAAGAVIEFELARTGAELLAIFDAPGSACRALAVTAMDAVNTLDVWAFIPAYSLFCISAALFLSDGALWRPLAFAAVASAALAAAADYLETTTLLAITSNIERRGALAPFSAFAAWAKFALLAAHALFCAGLTYVSAQRRTILGVLLILPTFGVLALAIDHTRYAMVLNVMFALAWFALLVVAMRDAARRISLDADQKLA